MTREDELVEIMKEEVLRALGIVAPIDPSVETPDLKRKLRETQKAMLLRDIEAHRRKLEKELEEASHYDSNAIFGAF